MGDDIVYLSAPCDLRGARQADIPWDAMRPFQPFLGQDAQMASFAAAAHLEGLRVRVLAAPEIYGSGTKHTSLAAGASAGDLIHIRFGPPCLPRVLKGAMNIVVLAEDVTIPLRLGRHPFAGGAALPSCVESIFVYDESTPIPDRIGREPARCVVLPQQFASVDMREDGEIVAQERSSDDVMVQSCMEFNRDAWKRWGISTPIVARTARATTVGASVLLPWNLAAPGSLVPDLLDKANWLAVQGRFPLTLIVLPYNDVPGSLDVLEKVAASCADCAVRSSDSAAVLLARPGSLRESVALLKICCRAWIDASDPEWRWSARRVADHGLPINFVSSLPSDVAMVHDPGPFAADALLSRPSDTHFGSLIWRNRAMSVRTLEKLAFAVTREADTPYKLTLWKPPDGLAQFKLRNALRREAVTS